MFKRIIFVVMVLLLVIGVLTGISSSSPEKLVAYHWWTAGGEREAIDKVFELFKTKYPGIEIVDNPVAGGGGEEMRMILMALLAAGMPPDTFQCFLANGLKLFVDAGYLEPVDDVWAMLNLEKRLPPMWPKALRIKGHYWEVPLNCHRDHWLWYDKKLFDTLGLKPPKSADDLIRISKAIKEKKPGVWPIGLGTRGKWTTVFLFDTILLSIAGPDFYERFYTGLEDITVRISPFRKALEKFKELVPYIYPHHAVRTWDESCGLLVTGDAAMVVMGDFALGYYLVQGWKPDVNFGAIPLPEDVWLGHGDNFPIAKGAPHPEAARLWLMHLADPVVQREFNLIKGSVAVLIDVPASVYPDPIRRRSAEDLANPKIRKVLNSIHGTLATHAFLSDYQDTLTEFLIDPNVDKAIAEVNDEIIRHKLAEECAWYWAK